LYYLKNERVAYNGAMLKELQDIGLSEKEAKVYMAALEIGRATADQLAKHSGIVRSTTYVQLESLMKKGLMSTYEEGKKTFFAPESPEYLKRIFDSKKRELEVRERELNDFLPQLVRQFESAGEKPLIRFFTGLEGIKSLREEMLHAKSKQWHVIYSHDALEEFVPDEARDVYSKKRIGLGIRSRLIYTRNAGPFEYPPRDLTERKFVSPERLKIVNDIAIYDHHVAIMGFHKKPFGAVISDEGTASSMRSLFELLWSSIPGDR
jgi:sugar-specific transcriptional regulator TrmB